MKVLVVDDQPDVVRGILDGVNWSRLKIEAAFGANSAAEAREILKREQIDILLCDIEMPGESGLHLVSWLREQGQSVKCIFLTAHADFAYAQSALKLEAADYLLQPASYAAIEGAILHAVERLQQERLAQLYSTMGRGAAQEALGFRRSILREFLLGIRGGAQEAAEKASAFGFSCMPETLCRCVWVQIQHWEGEPMEYGLLLYGFQNVLEELLAPMSRQTTVLSLGGDAYLILLDADESGGAYDALCSSLESFHSFAKQELHLGLTCLLGRSAVPFRELPAEYLRLQEAHRNNVARTCGVLPLESGAAPPDVEPDFAKRQSLLDEGCGKAVREEIHAYFDRLSRQGALNREVLSAFHESFLELFFGVLQQRRDRVREVFNDTFDYDAMLHACSTLPQLLEFVDFATDYAEARQGCRQAQGRAQIDRILSFIHKNLPRSIGRAEIARAVYLNPEYLSRLFKKEMGIGLNDYLVQERMKIAQSLLKNTSFSISIVASKVGYINFSHFAKAFKKAFGMSPSEYRKACEKEGK